MAPPVVRLKTWSRNRPSRFLLRCAAIGVMSVCCWLALNAENLRELIRAYEARNQELDRVRGMRDEISLLQARYESARKMGAETELMARERLGMHKPGEQVIYVKPGKPDETPAKPPPTPVPTPKSADKAKGVGKEKTRVTPTPTASKTPSYSEPDLPAPGRN